MHCKKEPQGPLNLGKKMEEFPPSRYGLTDKDLRKIKKEKRNNKKVGRA